MIRKFILIITLCYLVLGYGCSTDKPNDSITYSSEWSLEDIELLELINSERNVSLIIDGYVKKASEIRKNYFISIGEITHQNISHIIVLLEDKGFSYISEVLAFGYTSVRSAKEALFRSPVHRSSLLDTKHSYIGISIGKDNDGNMYYVIILANK